MGSDTVDTIQGTLSRRELDGQKHEQWAVGHDGAYPYWQQTRLIERRLTFSNRLTMFRVTVRSSSGRGGRNAFAKAEVWTIAGWVPVWTIDCPALLRVARCSGLVEDMQHDQAHQGPDWLEGGMPDEQCNAFDADAEDVIALAIEVLGGAH